MMEKLKSYFISRLDKATESNREFSSWPSSNYPIFIVLMLLVATAATLVIGDEKRAEELAIYAYYFLVIGVLIRFFELALPERTLQKLNQDMKQISGFIKQHALVVIQKTGLMLKKLYAILQPYLQRSMFEMKMRISVFVKQHPPEKMGEYIQKIGSMLRQQYLRLQRLHISMPEKNTAVISEISRNIAIFLSAFFIISLIYGWMIDWWFVERYLSNLILFILGFLTLHIFTRVRF